ncbi:hypothetical protein DFS33DRAFT_530015 [Desarmillaria ectypa]|nr:hypothetical protein DFS33DRAFT_530015 [Desarmillaria ectypa]
MTILEGPPSLRWLLNPISTARASSPPSFQTEPHARPEIKAQARDDVPKWKSSWDFSDLSTDSRRPLQPRDDNPSPHRAQASSIDACDSHTVPHNSKRRFGEIDDHDCRVSGVSPGFAAHPKPAFYKNKTAMRAPPKAKLPQHYYDAVSDTPLQPKLANVYGNEGSIQCPYTGCSCTFDIFTQYDEMKTHYMEHANRKAEEDIQRDISYMELEKVNGSYFSFAPKICTNGKGDALDPVANKQPSSRHTANPVSQSVHTKRRSPSSFAQKTVKHGKASQCPTSRTIYDVSHPSKAPRPSGSSLTPQTHRHGRTIYDVQHPTAKRS